MVDESHRTIDRLEHEARINALEAKVRDLLAKEREYAKEAFAIKLVERIVFGAMALIAMGVVGSLLGLVLIK